MKRFLAFLVGIICLPHNLWGLCENFTWETCPNTLSDFTTHGSTKHCSSASTTSAKCCEYKGRCEQSRDDFVKCSACNTGYKPKSSTMTSCGNTYTYTNCVCDCDSVDCGNKAAETSWRYQGNDLYYRIKTWKCNDCKTSSETPACIADVVEYSCAAGYYGNPIAADSLQCTKCPGGATSTVGKNDSVNGCYMEAGYPNSGKWENTHDGADGQYIYTTRCYYQG